MTLLEAADGRFGHDRDSAGALMVQPGASMPSGAAKSEGQQHLKECRMLQGLRHCRRLLARRCRYGPVQAHGEGCGGSGHLHPGGAGWQLWP